MKFQESYVDNFSLFQGTVNVINRLFVGIKINIGQIGTVINTQTQQTGIFDRLYQRGILRFQDCGGMPIIKQFPFQLIGGFLAG